MNYDDESLFGSPPPSPAREKSPALALPCARTGSNVQNVGTIALPGSHPNSECFFTTFIASSLDHSGPDQLVEQDQGAGPQIVCSNQVTPTRALKSVQKRKRSRQPSQQQPSVPPIDFPEPGRPIPRNFLRNQEGLLGTAGLIARVKPSHLLRIAGDHANNPIDIDSDNHAHSDQYMTCHFISKDTSRSNNDSSFIPDAGTANQAFNPVIPSVPKQDVVASLVQQQDVFPVVRSIMKLIAHAKTSSPMVPPPSSSDSPASSNAFMSPRSTLNEHSTTSPGGPRAPKRRKLKSVPAGAEDWDVPFPFSLGEGPEAYRETWEHERGRRLIMQLATLVKAAAQKAAIQKVAAQAPLKKNQQTAIPFDHLTHGSIPSAVGQTETVLGFPAQVQQSNQAPSETNADSTSYPSLCQPQPSYDGVIASLLDGVLSLPSEPGGEANIIRPLPFTDYIAPSSGDEWLSRLVGPLLSFPVADHGTLGEGFTCPNTSSPLPVSNEGPAAIPENPASDMSVAIDPVLLEEPQPTTTLNIPPPGTLYMASAPEHGLLDSQHMQSSGYPLFNQLSKDDLSASGHETCSSGEHSITDLSSSVINDGHQGPDVSPLDPCVDARSTPDRLLSQSCHSSTSRCIDSECAPSSSLSIMKAQDTPANVPTTNNRLTRHEILQQARARVEQLQAELNAQKRHILDMEMEAAVLHHLETPKAWSSARSEDVNL